MMKRFAKVFLVLVVVAAFAYWGYKQVQQTSSLLGKIHVNADSAIKIGVQEIKETLLIDALTSPIYYYNKASFKGSDDRDKIDKGINVLPFNIVFYTLPEFKNTFFSTFMISDSDAFEVYVKKELDKKSIVIEDFEKEGYRFAKVNQSKLAFAWNTDKLVLAFSPELGNTALQKVFNQVLTEGKTIENKENPLIEALADSNDHIVYIQGKSNIAINFADGKAILAGTIRTARPQKFQSEISMESIEDPSLQIYFDANFEKAENKFDLINALSEASFFAKNKLNVDEVLDRTNGFYSLGISGQTIQKDTIITYGYDANFEKVAERTIQEKTVPKIHMNLGLENNSLKDYLVSQNAVSTNSILEAFPLYQLEVKEGPMNTVLDNFKGRLTSQEKLKNSFFGAEINFKKLTNDLALPIATKYLENLEQLKLFASQKEENRIIVNGELTAADANINILSQVALKKQQDSLQ